MRAKKDNQSLEQNKNRTAETSVTWGTVLFWRCSTTNVCRLSKSKTKQGTEKEPSLKDGEMPGCYSRNCYISMFFVV